ncbi:MAG: hypothetical protein KW802_02495 [Candidatus Doudnabacteria bacterium]|nr:hypothetical protein [Candidatus Doudnabacteria bacterium]
MNRIARTIVSGFVMGFIFTCCGNLGYAQDRVSVNVAPSMVTVKEIFNVNDDSGGAYKHRVSPVYLYASVEISDGLTVRGRVALPNSLSAFPVQYMYRDDAKKTRSTDQYQVKLGYSDWTLGMQWHPAKLFRSGYALVNYQTTSYQRSADNISGMVVNGELVTNASVQYSYQTLQVGGGVAHEFRKFGFRAEATVAPVLSQLNYHTKESNDSGFLREEGYSNNGRGANMFAGVSYYVSSHVGLVGSLDLETFRYQNWFQRDNHMQPETRWSTYSFGVVTRF